MNDFSNSHSTIPKISFGETDVIISRLGLGTVKLGRNQGVKYPTNFELPTDQEASLLIQRAKDLGINFIDTAPAYGSSEERLGKLLKNNRNDWVICSKAGEDFSEGESSFHFLPEQLTSSVERSLKRLNTDWIDIVLIHSDGNDIDIINNGALDVLQALKQQGKIRAFGMSTKTIDGGILAAKKSDGVMVTYNLVHKEESPVLDYCHENNKGVLLKKVFASGHIATDGPSKEQNSLQNSMNFVFSHAANTCAVIGTINPDHLEKNVAAANRAININNKN